MVVKEPSSKTFAVPRREAILVFPEDSDYYGAEIRARLDVDVKTFFIFQGMGDDSPPEELTIAFRLFGDVIIKEWNLTDEDEQPTPPTGEGFMTLPPALCIEIIGAWAEQAATAGKA